MFGRAERRRSLNPAAVATHGLHAGQQRQRPADRQHKSQRTTYALGTQLQRCTGFTGYAPGTTFTGTVRRQWRPRPRNYTISDLNLSSSSSPVALFPFVESGATVRNLNLANVNITGTGSSTILGVVAGENRGTISNVHSLSGTVSSGSQTGVIAGGLVGQNTASSPTPARPPLSASEIPIPRPPRILRADWSAPISGPSRDRRRAAT